MSASAVVLFVLGALFGAGAVPQRVRQPPDANEGVRMSRIKLGGRKRRVASVAALCALCIGGTALAAWFYYSGAGGSGGAKAQTAQQVDALTLLPSASAAGDALIGPGEAGDVYATLRNNSQAASRLLSLSAKTITTDKPLCDTTGSEFTASTTNVGAGSPVVGVGQTSSRTKLGVLTGPTPMDGDCTSAVYSVTFQGTTSP